MLDWLKNIGSGLGQWASNNLPYDPQNTNFFGRRPAGALPVPESAFSAWRQPYQPPPQRTHEQDMLDFTQSFSRDQTPWYKKSGNVAPLSDDVEAAFQRMENRVRGIQPQNQLGNWAANGAEDTNTVSNAMNSNLPTEAIRNAREAQDRALSRFSDAEYMRQSGNAGVAPQQGGAGLWTGGWGGTAIQQDRHQGNVFLPVGNQIGNQLRQFGVQFDDPNVNRRDAMHDRWARMFQNAGQPFAWKNQSQQWGQASRESANSIAAMQNFDMLNAQVPTGQGRPTLDPNTGLPTGVGIHQGTSGNAFGFRNSPAGPAGWNSYTHDANNRGSYEALPMGGFEMRGLPDWQGSGQKLAQAPSNYIPGSGYVQLGQSGAGGSSWYSSPTTPNVPPGVMGRDGWYNDDGFPGNDATGINSGQDRTNSMFRGPGSLLGDQNYLRQGQRPPQDQPYQVPPSRYIQPGQGQPGDEQFSLFSWGQGQALPLRYADNTSADVFSQNWQASPKANPYAGYASNQAHEVPFNPPNIAQGFMYGSNFAEYLPSWVNPAGYDPGLFQ